MTDQITTDITPEEAVQRIRTALKRRSRRTWSVRKGTGSCRGWVGIQAHRKHHDRERGYGMTNEDCQRLAELLALGAPVDEQGLHVRTSAVPEFVGRAEGSIRDPYPVRHDVHGGVMSFYLVPEMSDEMEQKIEKKMRENQRAHGIWQQYWEPSSLLSEYMSDDDRQNAARRLRKSRTAMTRLIKMLEGDGSAYMDAVWYEERRVHNTEVGRAVTRWRDETDRRRDEWVEHERARRHTPEWEEGERKRLRDL